MTHRLVCDASVLVALLADSGSDGRWASQVLVGSELIGPALVLFEAANILRRLELSGLISADLAAQSHADLLGLAVEQWPYDLLAERVWEVRANLASYDASYVALAELVQAPFVTLDRRIGRAQGVRCEVRTP